MADGARRRSDDLSEEPDASQSARPDLRGGRLARAYMPGWRVQLRHMFRRRSGTLLDLGALAPTWTLRTRHFAGRQLVPIGQIRGSESRVTDFDAAFRPRARHTAARWCRVAEAWPAGVELPAIDLIQVGDAYFVRDGHHRISVASAFGAREIEALVTVWDVDGALPWQPRSVTPANQCGPDGRMARPTGAGRHPSRLARARRILGELLITWGQQMQAPVKTYQE